MEVSRMCTNRRYSIRWIRVGVIWEQLKNPDENGEYQMSFQSNWCCVYTDQKNNKGNLRKFPLLFFWSDIQVTLFRGNGYFKCTWMGLYLGFQSLFTVLLAVRARIRVIVIIWVIGRCAVIADAIATRTLPAKTLLSLVLSLGANTGIVTSCANSPRNSYCQDDYDYHGCP